MGRIALLVVAVAACGRLHFDALGDASGDGLAIAPDSAGFVGSGETEVNGSNTDSGDGYGWSVAISADGTTLAVGALDEASAATGIGGNQTDNGATNSGAVYVLVRSGSMWTQQAYVKASNTGANDQFGICIALSRRRQHARRRRTSGGERRHDDRRQRS